MTSKLTRERLQEIAEDGFLKHGESKELARIALAAMDSESGCLPLDYLQGQKDGLEWAAQLAEANHPETGDWLYDDPIELAKAIRKGPDMPPSQPALDTEPVAYRWNYGGTTIWRLLDTKHGPGSNPRCPRVIEPLYRHALPAPTAPCKWIPARERMPENKPGSYEYLVFETLNNRVNHDYWNVPDKGDDAFAPFWNYYGGHVTHWMPLPAAPQEVK
ncbi:DUF551 domain-containing protein [Klebsiella quasipneumoniae]|uniref:DUF551 domain-containing protein n=1 Tax=Klebsiella quasipneumoniae TaxID=1463165 RepID=UPI000E028731|nr:DUF551 domain-containing protein [Klebsiella quasipneumoniae]STR06210.1 Protein of uncharacterised function (DUF551) [Klebsiella quasipneumoniae]